MNWHPEILPRKQRTILAEVGAFLTPRGFYLGGGTGLALQLGHRRSVDLDWFTTEQVREPLRLAQQLRDGGIPFVTEHVDVGTLHGAVRSVRLSLLEYRYPLLGRLRHWARRVAVAARADLAAMKLAAVAQRGSKKDFVDIYAMHGRSCSLPQMLRWYQNKYAIQDLGHVLYALAYFEDADADRMPRLLWKMNWRTVKESIRSWVRDVAG